MINLASPLSRTATVAALLGSLALAACASDYDQNDQTQGNAAAQQTQTQPAPANQDWSQNNASTAHHHKWNGEKAVEARIKTLHDKLMITADQETAWDNVAQTMRDNESALDQQIQQRHANPESMTAVEDLQSYQRITQTRADGMQKMVTSFSSLYDQMTPAQQKNADEVFGRFEGHRGHHHMAKKHHVKK